MATTRGCFGVVKAGSPAIVVGELTAWSFTEAAEEIDTSSMGTCTKSSNAGAVKTTGEFTYWWDPADTGQDELVTGQTVDLELYPGGEGTGSTYYTGTGIVLSKGVNTDVDSVVSSTASFTINGAMTEQVVP